MILWQRWREVIHVDTVGNNSTSHRRCRQQYERGTNWMSDQIHQGRVARRLEICVVIESK